MSSLEAARERIARTVEYSIMPGVLYVGLVTGSVPTARELAEGGWTAIGYVSDAGLETDDWEGPYRDASPVQLSGDVLADIDRALELDEALRVIR